MKVPEFVAPALADSLMLHVKDPSRPAICASPGKEATARSQAVLSLLSDVTRLNVRCLGVTKDGQPRHPLYVAAATQPVPYEPATEVSRAQ